MTGDYRTPTSIADRRGDQRREADRARHYHEQAVLACAVKWRLSIEPEATGELYDAVTEYLKTLGVTA